MPDVTAVKSAAILSPIPIPQNWFARFVLLPLIGLASLVGAGAGLAYTHLRSVATVEADGRSIQVAVFRGTVGSALRAAGVRVGISDRVNLPLDTRLSDGTVIRVRRPVVVNVLVDRQLYTVETAARTPEELLTALGIPLGPRDQILPSPTVALVPGARVRVARVTRVVVGRRVPILAGTVSQSDPMLPRGKVAMVAGQPGIMLRQYLQTFADGQPVSSTFIGARVLQAARPRVIKIGTRTMIASRGQFAGYEFMDIEATGYAPWYGRGVDDITAIGMKAGYGVVAVDPTLIPLRSRLFIEGYGYAIAGDTGGAIKGLRIDLGFDRVKDAKKWGRRRNVRVYILRRGGHRK